MRHATRFTAGILLVITLAISYYAYFSYTGWMLIIYVIGAAAMVRLVARHRRRIATAVAKWRFIMQSMPLREWRQNRMLRRTLQGTLLSLGLYTIFLRYEPEALINVLGQVKPLTSHYVNVATIFALVLTVAGLYFTYKDIKHLYQRIDSYVQFYESALGIVTDFVTGKADRLYIYGPTPLPGNVAYDSKSTIERYRALILQAIETIANRRGAQVWLAFPSIAELTANYDNMKSTVMFGHSAARWRGDKWHNFVESRCEDARKFYQTCVAKNAGDALVLSLRGDRADRLNDGYLISNGRQAVYAKPLHYVQTGGPQDLIHVVPHLVGFLSSDYETLQAFETHFKRISNVDQLGIVEEGMYAKHVLSRKNIVAAYGEDVSAWDGRVVAQLQHDNFDGEPLVGEYVELLSLTENSRVLDLGCGYGGMSLGLAKATKCTVFGIEFQAERLDIARRLMERPEYKEVETMKRVAFFRGDYSQFELQRDEHLTDVIATLSLLHVEGKHTVLHWLSQMLRPGAQLLVEDFFQGSEWARQGDVEMDKEMPCFRLLATAEFTALCTKYGFELVSSQDRTSDWHAYVAARAAAFDGETVPQASEHLKAVVQVFERCDHQEKSRARAFAHQVGRCFDREVVSGWRFLFRKT